MTKEISFGKIYEFERKDIFSKDQKHKLNFYFKISAQIHKPKQCKINKRLQISTK